MTGIRLLIRVRVCACARERRVTPVLVCGKLSKLEGASGRKRNSQDDTLPRSKINSETESLLQLCVRWKTLEQKAALSQADV